jgi:hypothetical protein
MSDHQHNGGGTPVTPEEKAQTDALRACFDPKASLDRIDTFAKWIFSSCAIVGALGAGLSNSAFAKTHGIGTWLLAGSILCLGISLVAACTGIHPDLVSVRIFDPADLQAKVNAMIKGRQRLLSVAAFFYGLAIVVAATVPFLSAMGSQRIDKITYSVDGKGALSADLASSGAPGSATIEFSVEQKTGSLATAATTVDSSGEANLHLGPVQLTAGSAQDIVEREQDSGSKDWREIRRISVTE